MNEQASEQVIESMAGFQYRAYPESIFGASTPTSALNMILKHGLNSNEAAVLLIVVEYASWDSRLLDPVDASMFFLTPRELEEEVGLGQFMSRRVIRNSLKSLEARGFIRRRNDFRKNGYYIGLTRKSVDGLFFGLPRPPAISESFPEA